MSTLGYWSIQGKAAPIKLMIKAQSKVEIEFKSYTEGAEWFGKDKLEILKTNPFANLPYYTDESGTTIAETGAIFRALGTKFGFIGQNCTELANVESVDGILEDCFSFIRALFAKDSYQDKKSAEHEKMIKLMTKLDTFLSNHKFASGSDQLTWVDFKLFWFFGLFSKYSSKVAAMENLVKHASNVSAAAGSGFVDFYENMSATVPVLPSSAAWGGDVLSKLKAEF